MSISIEQQELRLRSGNVDEEGKVASHLLSADTSDAFWLKFNAEINTAQVNLTELAVEDIGNMKSLIHKLQVFATDSTSILPGYDIKRAQEILEEIGRLLRTREEQLKPKKKFHFKSREKVRAAAAAAALARLTGTSTDTGMSDASSFSSSSSSSASNETTYSVNKMHGKGKSMSKDQGGVPEQAENVQNDEDESDGKEIVITLTAEIIGEVNGTIRSLIISDCSNVTIIARCVLGSVRIENCNSCNIYLGPCRTSTYLDILNSCVIFTACHQLRVHKCHQCQLFVKCNSHPIIEDCSMMGFAPYDVSYPQLTTHLESAELSLAKCWDNVVDFRWHRTTQSPNWHVILSENRPLARIDTNIIINDDTTGKDIDLKEITMWGHSDSGRVVKGPNNVTKTAGQAIINKSIFHSMTLDTTATTTTTAHEEEEEEEEL